MIAAVAVLPLKGGDKLARSGSWLQTYSGHAMWPLDPRSEEIFIGDISSALSKMCRYAGHCLKFYSVAEHSVLVASMVPDEFKLSALMHDASEAYLVDIPRPLKPYLTNYYEIEDKLMGVIANKFGFQWPSPAVVKRVDNQILTDERLQNMAPPPFKWDEYEQNEPVGVQLQFWDPERSRREFVDAFYRYGGK